MPRVFGFPARVPRPVLFVLVYGIFVVIVGVTATAQTTMVSANFTASTMQSVVGTDAALVRSVVNAYLEAGDLDVTGPTPERRIQLEAYFSSLVRRAEILRIELRRPDWDRHRERPLRPDRTGGVLVAGLRTAGRWSADRRQDRGCRHERSPRAGPRDPERLA